MNFQLLGSFIRQAGVHGYRRTAFGLPIIFAILLVLALVSAMLTNAATYIIGNLLAMLWVIIIVGLAVYSYFAYKKTNMLRTEEYLLEEQQIKRGLIGDTKQGFKDDHNRAKVMASTKPMDALSTHSQNDAEIGPSTKFIDLQFTQAAESMTEFKDNG